MNKRQRKKQQKQQKLNTLTKRGGLREREARRIVKDERSYKQTVKKIRRKEREENRFLKLLSAGFNRTEAHKLKSRSDDRINQTIDKRKRSDARKRLLEEKFKRLIESGFDETAANRLKRKSWGSIEEEIKKKESGLLSLFIGYKDKTEWTSSDEIQAFKSRYKRKGGTIEQTAQAVQGWLNNDESFGFLGDYRMQVTEDANRTRSYQYALGYQQMYLGKGRNLKVLMNLIEIMMVLLYTPDEKDGFIVDLVENLRLLDNKAAQKNADYIERTLL